MKKIAILLLSAFVGIASAKTLPPGTLSGGSDQQVVIGQSPDGAVLVLDGGSLKIDGDKRTFKVMVVEPDGTVSEEGAHILGVVIKNSIDCKKHTGTVLSSVLLSEDGKVLSVKKTPGPEIPIPPKSTGAEVEKMVCTPPDGTPYKAPKKKLPPGTESV